MLTEKVQKIMTRSLMSMIAKTAHSQSEPPAVIWRSALGGLMSSELPIISTARYRSQEAWKGFVRVGSTGLLKTNCVTAPFMAAMVAGRGREAVMDVVTTAGIVEDVVCST